MSAIERFSLPGLSIEIKLAILRNLRPSQGVVLFAVSKEWSNYASAFWEHHLVVDFALYTGNKIPSIDLLDRTAIDLINRFFQVYKNTTHLEGDKILKLYQPLTKEEVKQGFCSTYKKIYISEKSKTLFHLFWMGFLITQGSIFEYNQGTQALGINIISSDPIKCSRRSYRLLAILGTDPSLYSMNLLNDDLVRL